MVQGGVHLEPTLQATGIAKYFGSIRALEHVDFEIYPGEVVAVLGDNGAGKSTFIKILSGVYHPDQGEIRLNGELVRLNSPMDARKKGIETVYQDLALAPQVDVTSNIFLGREMMRKGLLGKIGFLDRKAMRDQVKNMLGQLKASVKSVNQVVDELSGGQRQAVAIVRAVSWGTNLVIMDEPTAALGVEESAKTLELIKEVKSKGIPVIFITHTIPFAFDVADRIVVLRLGKSVVNLMTHDTHMDEVVQWITGSKSVENNY
ncbi:sugar ABC transporter ATP-binding protein [Alicyclobacillaceae bacterium I2511]|nr:sugar ABC transporter ATP-binding protein [Alicyclobacillaceae bacterium I2511]